MATAKRISDRIRAYRNPDSGDASAAQPDGTKDQQVSIRLHPFIYHRLEVLARHARMSRSQLMLEILQDGAEDILLEMDDAVRNEVNAEVNERLRAPG